MQRHHWRLSAEKGTVSISCGGCEKATHGFPKTPPCLAVFVSPLLHLCADLLFNVQLFWWCMRVSFELCPHCGGMLSLSLDWLSRVWVQRDDRIHWTLKSAICRLLVTIHRVRPITHFQQRCDCVCFFRFKGAEWPCSSLETPRLKSIMSPPSAAPLGSPPSFGGQL